MHKAAGPRAQKSLPRHSMLPLSSFVSHPLWLQRPPLELAKHAPMAGISSTLFLLSRMFLPRHLHGSLLTSFRSLLSGISIQNGHPKPALLPLLLARVFFPPTVPHPPTAHYFTCMLTHSLSHQIRVWAP